MIRFQKIFLNDDKEMYMTKDEIKEKIKALKAEIVEGKGEKCQVYSRVVGYLRPVQNWNIGKKQEYSMRKVYDIEHSSPSEK